MIDFTNAGFFELKEASGFAQQVAPILIDGEQPVGLSPRYSRRRRLYEQAYHRAQRPRHYREEARHTSLPYSKIVAYSVETAGTFDLDAELDIWISGVGKIRFEFRGKSNILEISKFISRHVL